MKVYIATDVARVRRLHQSLFNEAYAKTSVATLLAQQADRLWHAHKAGDIAATVEIKNHHPTLTGQDPLEILQYTFSEHDALLTIAREHGFQDLGALEAAQDLYFDEDFELAVDGVVNGNLVLVRRLLNQNPDLALATSVLPHAATLLHYLASNGTEIRRQIVPLNASALLDFLLTAGAKRDACARVYNGSFTFEQLFFTSGHPERAGILDEVRTALNKHKV